jgi:NaMN:DMB phosphoribosyltransferase
MSLKSLLGGLAVIVAAIAIISALPDVKRYIRISTM